MSDLLSKLREEGIKRVNQIDNSSQEEQSAAKALQKPTLGFKYCLYHYDRIQGRGRKNRDLHSLYVEELFVRARRADSVLTIFRASPRTIREDEQLIRVANHVNLYLFMAGSRLERINHLMKDNFASRSQTGRATIVGRINVRTESSARPGKVASQAQSTWWEGEERKELERLMSELSVLTHCLLVGIAKDDIVDDLGAELERTIRDYDPFFSFADLLTRWTVAFIENPFGAGIQEQSKLLGDRESTGFFSAILYAEDAMRLARLTHIITPAGLAGSMMFATPGSKLRRGSAEPLAGSEHMSARGEADVEQGASHVHLNEEVVGDTTGSAPRRPSLTSFLQKAGSQARLLGLGFTGNEGQSKRGGEEYEVKQVAELIHALDDAATWMKQIGEPDKQDNSAREITWRLSQHTCAVQALVSSKHPPILSQLGSIVPWALPKVKTSFGETLLAIKKREIKELEKSRKLEIKGRVLHTRIFEHPNKASHEFPKPEPWRTHGITYLGPFGLMDIETVGLSVRTQISEDGQKGLYKVDCHFVGEKPAKMDPGTFDKKKANFEKKMRVYLRHFGKGNVKELAGMLSPVAKRTVDADDIGVADKINRFAWAYPLEGMTEQLARETFQELQASNVELDELDFFMLNGAYFYWRKNDTSLDRPVQIKSLFTGAPQLLFSEPRKLPEEWYSDDALWGDITLEVLKRDLYAVKFRWLTPDEARNLSPDVPAEFVHGAFAYRYVDKSGKLYPAANNFFNLYEPPKTDATVMASRARGHKDEELLIAMEEEDAVNEGGEGEAGEGNFDDLVNIEPTEEGDDEEKAIPQS